jgi:hypothetical protein
LLEDSTVKKRRQRSEGDKWASGWPFKKGGRTGEREKPRIWKEDLDKMRGAWSEGEGDGGSEKGGKQGESWGRKKVVDMGSQGKGGERNTRGEDGSGVTGLGTESGDCWGEGGRVRGHGDFEVGKEKVVLEEKGAKFREGVLRTNGVRVTDGVLKSDKIQQTKQLLLLLQRQKHKEVEGLDGPVDGDRIMANGTYERNRIKDGKYWVGGQTTSMSTTNGVRIRSWKCGGGGEMQGTVVRVQAIVRRGERVAF